MSTRYNTGNPIESTDVRDMSDNAKNFDEFSISTQQTFTDRLGAERRTLPSLISQAEQDIYYATINAGFQPAAFDFVTGGTLIDGDRNKAVFNKSPAGDNNWYAWQGTFPKIIPPNSTPETSGGFGDDAWKPVTNNALFATVREAIRRSYSSAGYNLVDGSFESGGTIANESDVILSESDGCAYLGPIGYVTAGTSPSTPGFINASRLISASSGGYLAFSTVQDMKGMTPLGLPADISTVVSTNTMARTISYHPGWAATSDPVGGATYTLTTLAAVRSVRGAGWEPDGYVDHYLEAGDGATYVAVILTGESISIEQAGAIPYDPLLDVENYNSIQAALNWANSSYGMARQITAGVGDFYYSKTLLIKSNSVALGLCPGIIGSGWNRTNLIKTTNTPADGVLDYSVDAYVSYETRSQTQTLYSYSSQLKHITFKSAASSRHAYGIYGKLVSHMDWEEIEVQSAIIGVYSFDAWLIRWGGVRANLCDLGFKIGGTGTTLGWKNVWAHNCKEGGYDITGVVYAEWSSCAADQIFDHDNPTVNKVAYKFKNCQGIHLSGCGTENVSEAFLLDNSIVKATGFRVNSIRAGAAGQTLIRAINGAGGSFDTCGFTSVPASSAISVQSKDSTSHLSFQNSAFQIANSNVPNDASSRRQGLVSSMPLDVQGLKTVRVAMSGATMRNITALKPGCGFQMMSGVAESADNYIVLSKPYWAYSEISTNPASPTTIGFLANAVGVSQTSLRACRVVDGNGVENLQFNFSGAISVTILFTLQTAQHW